MTIGTKNNYRQTTPTAQINSAKDIFQGINDLNNMKSGDAMSRIQSLGNIAGLIGLIG